MKGKLYGLNGEEEKKVELPRAFEETYRPDLIKKAHLAERSSRYQPKGTDPRAGMKNTAEYRGRRRSYLATINTGNARLPRIMHYPQKGRAGRVAKVPHSRGGRRSHPPKVEKKLKEKINKKERIKALKSALAATTLKETIEERGHIISEEEKFPIIADNDLEEIKKTKKVVDFLEKIGLDRDLEKSRKGKKIKQGKGKARGRKYRRRKTALIVIGEDKGIKRAGRNIPGVDVVTAEKLSVDKLAPGGNAGRITIFTENALEEIKKRLGE